MAAPNLIGATTITGKTTGANLVNTSATTIISNPTSSGKCLKVNTLNVANYGSTQANVSVQYYMSADTSGTAYAIVGNIIVPAGSTLNVIDKTSQYYIEEGKSIGATAGTGNTLIVTASYEDIV